MIRVAKPETPAKLAEGIVLTAADCALYDEDAMPYDSGVLAFEIDSKIYGHAQVKDVLRTAQHSKCCFCEGIFEANAAADVEHFRPKKYSQQARRQAKLYPGYYWLGYIWENLYYSCQVCNRSHKKNFFPLADPGQRALNHHGSIANEAPLILDPSGPLDPRDHIRFADEVAVGTTVQGRTTVDYVALNRLPLIEARLELYQTLDLLRKIAAMPEDGANAEALEAIQDAGAFLLEAVLPTSKFSAMASDMLAPPAA
ncbi:hypothetical protein CVO77_17190 [Sphingopyxis lindanitolerans]|uniref:HNH nuclease domain-containing protein n=1 Tax=Sphingopyxis lindanitolerans TaxID=2054227 RepID=A0A2S8B2Z7_9SPHN|nr:hypothetical protein [Sphingopyxis lindanitolerans]PQM26737.1 hypothetical protein CVO77_17190 [Sphingopyxis lindanitolerans]